MVFGQCAGLFLECVYLISVVYGNVGVRIINKEITFTATVKQKHFAKYIQIFFSLAVLEITR